MCEKMIPTGGLLRFDKLAGFLRPYGYELYFFPLKESVVNVQGFQNGIILKGREVFQQNWDFTFVPGAGFSDEVIESFGDFSENNRFGKRIQFVLSDRSRLERFLFVNREFQPVSVVFNNPWTKEDIGRFRAEFFYTIIGAVDCSFFTPGPGFEKERRSDRKEIVLGGQAHKNPWPIFSTMKYLPKNYILKMFGHHDGIISDKRFQEYFPLYQEGRIRFAGYIFGDELLEFYRRVHAIVSTELFAGWSNMGAEALACGVPLFCTVHGTSAFAVDGETAVILDKLTPQKLSKQIENTFKNPHLMHEMARRGREKIREFDWPIYAEKVAMMLEEVHGSEAD